MGELSRGLNIGYYKEVLNISQGLYTLAMLAAAIIAVAIVIGVIFVGLSQSKEVASAGYDSLTEADRIANNETIQTFRSFEKKGMPAASCFTLLKENPELIVSLTCNICGKTTTGAEVGDCIKNHMHGRVKTVLTEEESGGTYTAVLSEA